MQMGDLINFRRTGAQLDQGRQQRGLRSQRSDAVASALLGKGCA
jgi:hypothetical protein